MLVFDQEEPSRLIPAYNFDAARADLKALNNVRNFAVVNAPEIARSVLDALDKLLPITIRSFHSEADALHWLQSRRARPSG